jgi:hypothetical protein
MYLRIKKMLQRIQTVFLLAAAILLTCMFFNPFITLKDLIRLDKIEYIRYADNMVIYVLLIVATFIGYLNIFLYRKRMLQIRLCIFNSLILLGLQGVIAYYVFPVEWGASFSLTAAFPVVAAILTFLALRYIARDEAMLKTMERLRK